MLTRTGLGNDAALAHALRQQCLANAVVDLVRAGMEQVLALQIDLRAAKVLGQAASKKQRRGPSGKLLQQVLQALTEAPVLACVLIGALQLVKRRHQRFGNVLATELAETPG